MVGITSYGAYVPFRRLSLAAIGSERPADVPMATTRNGGPEKAVASWDEDSVTMAVAAAVACLRGIDRSQIDGVLFASTSYAYQEKQAAAIVAKALDLRRDVMTADLGASLRAGTTALRTAIDMVRAGSAKRVLVVSGEARMAAPRSPMEAHLGDAAVALLVGENDVAASFAGAHSVSDEIIDVWRTAGDPFVHAWEERFIVDHGYRRNVREAVSSLLRTHGLSPKDLSKVALYGPEARSHAAVARDLGIGPGSLQDPLFGKVGNAGAAFVLLQLIAALESAERGERLLAVSYGDGADALLFEVTPAIDGLRDRRAVSWHLARRCELASYDKYLRFRQLLATEHDRRAGAGISATIHYRDRDSDVSLLGQRCRRCGTAQYPFQRVCFCCHARDEFERVRLSDKTGKVLAFTFDNFAGSPDPPLIATVTDVEGARLFLQMTDASPKDVRLDMPVELTFRKIHEGGGTPNYYWKCTPVLG